MIFSLCLQLPFRSAAKVVILMSMLWNDHVRAPVKDFRRSRWLAHDMADTRKLCRILIFIRPREFVCRLYVPFSAASSKLATQIS